MSEGTGCYLVGSCWASGGGWGSEEEVRVPLSSSWGLEDEEEVVEVSWLSLALELAVVPRYLS